MATFGRAREVNRLVRVGSNKRRYALPPGTWSFAETKRAKMDEEERLRLRDRTKQAEWLLRGGVGSVSTTRFFTDFWQRNPLLVRASNDHGDLTRSSTRFAQLFSMALFRNLVEGETEHVLRHRLDVDVTRVVDGVRQTLFDEGLEVRPRQGIWSLFADGMEGCTLRLLRPQDYSEPLRLLCGELEEFWTSPFGANAYLTPPNAQGFAPHYDDVDVFICQVSGRKHWEVYSSSNEDDALPRFSSPDFSSEDLKGHKKILDVELCEGDMLYLPRGTIHKANCTDSPSLHITLSTSQRWTWTDFLAESMIPILSSISHSHLFLRSSLPVGSLAYMGIAQSTTRSRSMIRDRTRFQKEFRKAMRVFTDNFTLDQAVDLFSRRFYAERCGALANEPQAPSLQLHTVSLFTRIRQSARHAARLVLDDDGELPLLISHVGRASRELSAPLLQQTCTPVEAEAINYIFSAFPSAVRVASIPLETPQDRLDLADALIELGIVVVVQSEE